MPNTLTLSPAGLRTLVAHEGAIDGLYDDPAGFATFGVGHLVHPAHKSRSVLLHAARTDSLCAARVKTRWPGTAFATPYLERAAVGDAGFDALTAAARQRARDVLAQAIHGRTFAGLTQEKRNGVIAAAEAAVAEEVRLLRQSVDSVLAVDVKPFEKAVNEAVTGVDLLQDEFDALVSLAFNIGAGAFRRSTLLKTINANTYRAGSAASRRNAIADVEKAFLAWNKAGGKVLEGLARRRREEADLFLGPARAALNALEAAPGPRSVQPRASRSAAPVRRAP